MAKARVVVDPSVAIKWYIPENQSAEARDFQRWLLEGAHRILVPSLFFEEIANILWKKEILLKEQTPQTTREILWEVLRLPLGVYTDRHEMLPKAIDVARGCRVSIYDAVYVTTAIQNQAFFVTADQRLVNQLSSSAFARFVLSLDQWSTLTS